MRAREEWEMTFGWRLRIDIEGGDVLLANGLVSASRRKRIEGVL
jgi:hypothetical protein